MKATKLDVLSKCLVPVIPEEDRDAASKRYVDSNTAGGIFITSVVPTSATGNNIVGFYEYVQNTIPSDYLITKATTNVEAIRISFLASPKVNEFTIGVVAEWGEGQTKAADFIEVAPEDRRLYAGYVDIVLDPARTEETVRLVSSTGSDVVLNLDVLIGGPAIQSATLGALPDGQTELKAGDTVSISGTVGNDATEIDVLNSGISGDRHSLTLGAEDSAGEGLKTFSGTITVSSRSGTLAAQLTARNMLGTEGDVFNSDTATLNQTKPSISNAAYDYPPNQQAIKNAESVGISITITDADSVQYDVAAGLTINNPTVYAQTKTVSRIDDGTIEYSINDNNLLGVTATRAANGAVATKYFDINVVNVPPTATLAFIGNPARLRSSAGGEDYTLQVIPSQPLIEAPSALSAAANAGEFVGSWSQSGSNYRHTFKVVDADLRGTFQFTGLEITGLSGIVSNTIANGSAYTIGGAVARILVVPALSRVVAIGTSVADFSKTRAQYVDADELTRQPDTSNVVRGFTITDSEGNFNANGDYLFISDEAFAGANTSGTLQIEFEETV
tara:strand:- start:3817 stop:5496 length:1680 start_codon:yes stop_codon:yes gene_type:complete